MGGLLRLISNPFPFVLNCSKEMGTVFSKLAEAVAAMFSLRRFSLVVIAVFAAYGCAPQRPYRAPIPRSSATLPRAPQPPPPPAPQTARQPVPEEPKIREQDIKPPPAPPAAKETKDQSKQASVGETRAIPEPDAVQPLAPPLPDDSSLLAKITPGTPPQRAASLRLTEEGRRLLDAGEPAKALSRLEQTIVIDSTNPYGYFYLAKTQHRLGRYKESLNFLDVAESRLGAEPFWLAEIYALRGDNYRGLGQLQKAEASYLHALRLNSGNRAAAEGLSRLQAESSAVAK